MGREFVYLTRMEYTEIIKKTCHKRNQGKKNKIIIGINQIGAARDSKRRYNWRAVARYRNRWWRLLVEVTTHSGL